MQIQHTRVEITTVKVQRACPYCKARAIKRKTCGAPECQYAHHIAEMRKTPRKTDFRYPSRTISTLAVQKQTAI